MEATFPQYFACTPTRKWDILCFEWISPINHGDTPGLSGRVTGIIRASVCKANASSQEQCAWSKPESSRSLWQYDCFPEPWKPKVRRSGWSRDFRWRQKCYDSYWEDLPRLSHMWVNVGSARISEKDFHSPRISLRTDDSSLTRDFFQPGSVSFLQVKAVCTHQNVMTSSELHPHTSLQHVQILEPKEMDGKMTNKIHPFPATGSPAPAVPCPL